MNWKVIRKWLINEKPHTRNFLCTIKKKQIGDLWQVTLTALTRKQEKEIEKVRKCNGMVYERIYGLLMLR